MFTESELMLRQQQPEVVEDKRRLSAELEQRTAEFLAKGGKVTDLPSGVKRCTGEAPVRDSSESGYPGIRWAPDQNKWAVRTPNSRVHLGYATTLCEALQMQEKHHLKQTWKGGYSDT